MANDNEQLITEFVDLQATDAQAKAFLAQLQKISDAFDAVNKQTISLQGMTGTKEVLADIKSLNQAMASLTVEKKKLLSIDLEQLKADRLAKQEKREQVAAAKQLEKATIAQEKAVEALSNDYKQLSLAYNEAALKAKNLALQQGANAPAAKAALANANELGAKLKEVDAATGTFNRNVGNYAGGIGGYFQKAFTGLRTIANILPGLGLSGVLLLLSEPIIAIGKAIFGVKDAYNAAAEKLKLFNEVSAEGNKQASSQITDAKILYKVATDVNLSMQTRLDAVKALKEEFPGTFKNLKDEVILNGKSKDSYDELVKSILATSRARAAKGKIDEIEAKRLDIEFQKQKIRNATAQNVASATADADESGVVVNTKAEVQKIISLRADAALKEQDIQDQRLKNQSDFLVKFAGGEKAIAKVIEEDQGKKHKEKKPDTKDADEAKRIAAELAKYKLDLESKLARAKADYREEDLKEIATQAKEVADNVKAGLQNRLDAYSIYAEAQAAIIARNADSEIAIQEKTLARIQALKNKPGKLSLDDQKLIASEELVTQTITNLRQKREDGLNKLAIENEKIRLNIVSTAQNELIATLQKNADSDIAAATIDKDNRLRVLDELFTNGTIKAKEYANAKAEIEYESAANILEINIQLAKDILEAMKAAGLDITEQEKKIAALSAALARARADHAINANKAIAQSSKDAANSIEEDLKKIQKISEKVFEVIGSVLNASIIGQKNALREQADQIEKNSAKQIEAINNSAASEQEKAAKIAIVNARAQAQKEQIEQKNRQLDQQRAKFEKAATIAKLIIETAAAVVHQLYSGDPYTALARAAAVGVLGALQVAIAIATPIPKYKMGTKTKEGHPGGFAVVGDGGRSEAVVLPSGKLWATPSTDTLIDLPKGSHVFPDINDWPNQIMMMAAKPPREMPSKESQMLAAMEQQNKGLRRDIQQLQQAILSKPTEVTRLKDGELRKFIERANGWTEYKNRML